MGTRLAPVSYLVLIDCHFQEVVFRVEQKTQANRAHSVIQTRFGRVISYRR